MKQITYITFCLIYHKVHVSGANSKHMWYGGIDIQFTFTVSYKAALKLIRVNARFLKCSKISFGCLQAHVKSP